jgi:single-stranded-DNA-specific exonuclease
MKRWRTKPLPEKTEVTHLKEVLGVNTSIASLLVQRQIGDYETAKDFFRPNLDHLHDPFLMKDMDKAVQRIYMALHRKERIMVYGDYDVDGTTSVTLMYGFLKNIHSDIIYYIPDRYSEGYGISYQGIDHAHDQGVSLIVCLDCGIKANDKIDYANAFNIDFIICDHHLPSDSLPKAYAILDPKRKDCAYPFKELSGCGVGFKLIQAIQIQLSEKIPALKKIDVFQLLDLVAVSTAADIVPIVGENRILTHFGLKQINENPRPGLKAILDLNNFTKVLRVSDIVFLIAPRINAAGRIEHAFGAVKLLLADNVKEAEELALAINKTNSNRKDLDSEITQEAYSLIDNNENISHKKSTVIYQSHWHKGVIGIVASRLIEKYYKPTVVLTESNGRATGSARSVKDFDVYSAIEECSDLLEQFGGHKYAAGLTLRIENIPAFSEKFEKVVSSTITNEMLVPEVEIDLEINFSEINPKSVRILKQFAPFGPENMTPIFMSKDVFDSGYGKIVGNNHLKLELYQKNMPEIKIQAIGYDMGESLDYFKRNIPVSIVYQIDENIWNNQTQTQLILKEIKAM